MKIEIEIPIQGTTILNEGLGILAQEVQEIFNVSSCKITVIDETITPGTSQIQGWYSEKRL
jgi:hypothetical protein